MVSYSHIVRWAKIGLPLAALGILSSLFLLPRDQSLDGGLIFSTADLVALGEGMAVSNPRFTGNTDDGEPFVVRADSATPDGPDPTEVALAAPRADLEQADRSVTLTAATGVLRPDEGRLSLGGGVRLATTDGYVVTADAVEADVKAGRVSSPGPVFAEGPQGAIEAGSFRAERLDKDALDADAANRGLSAGDRFWFENGVKLTYDPRPRATAPERDAAEGPRDAGDAVGANEGKADR